MDRYILLKTDLELVNALYEKGLLLPARKFAALKQYIVKNPDVISDTDSGIKVLGLSIGETIDRLRSSPAGRDIFGDEGATRDNPNTNNGGAAAPLTDAQRAAKAAGLTDAEWHLKGPAFKLEALGRVTEPPKENWRFSKPARPFAGLSAEEVNQLTPQQKLDIANQDFFEQQPGWKS